MSNNYKPARWQQEIMGFCGVKSCLVIEGNIGDLYPFKRADAPKDEPVRFLNINELLATIFNAGAEEQSFRFMFCDPLYGFGNPLDDNEMPDIIKAAERNEAEQSERFRTYNPSRQPEPFTENRLTHNASVSSAALSIPLEVGKDDTSKRKPVAVVWNLASRMATTPESLSLEENALFERLFLGIHDELMVDGLHRNTLILLVNKVNDLPTWFYYDNPAVRQVSIPNPNRLTRQMYASRSFGSLDEKQLERLVDGTEGLKLREIDQIGIMSEISGTTLDVLADIYKYGLKDTPWEEVRLKLKDNPEDKLRRRVLGQDQAIEMIIPILKSAVMGLSGTQNPKGNSPRGVVFVSGPTGTGKTEIIKAIAEVLFGDERKVIRFDMSEYAAEHSDQKLMGAPPGYVGYGAGGQLTNAVRENPCSILLFDEIEKAHPRIMEKFLQLLEDGRMTDGQGHTVDFSQTLIFFTSNVGISEVTCDAAGNVTRSQTVRPGDDYESIREKITEAMKRHFAPEFCGRIEGIVVFNYIDEAATRLIVERQVGLVGAGVLDKTGVTMRCSEEALEHLCALSAQEEVREYGGRGIKKTVRSHYLNPLSAWLFDSDVAAGSEVLVGVGGDGDQDRHLTFRIVSGHV